MERYPRVHEEVGSLSVEFAPGIMQSARESLHMVLDFGQFGDVIGVEILNLILEAGTNCLGLIGRSVRTDGDGLKYSYDEDSDSFSLRLKSGRSFDQKAVQGAMFRDDNGQIVALSADWR